EFELDAAADATKITVAATGFVRSTVNLDAANDKPLIVTLSRGRTLRGRVVDEKGQPLSGIAVAIGGSDGSFSTESDNAGSQSAADGSYAITGIGIDEPTRVTFTREGYLGVERKIAVGRDDIAMEDITMRRGI